MSLSYIWCVNEYVNTHLYVFTVTFNSTVYVKGCKSITFTVHLTSCIFLFITLVHSFPDVSLDTLAHDAYRLSRSGCPCPIQVCSLDMSSWEQRHSCHWITSVDSSCPPLSEFSSFLSSFSFSGQHAMSCALHHAHSGAIHGNTLLLLFVVVLLF